MFNVIRMELTRMFKSRVFYVCIIAGALFAGLMTYSLAPSMNKFYDGLALTGDISPENTACPNNVCGSFIASASLFIGIFTACFVGDFYKNGFCKNVVGGVKHKYYFQVSKTVCIMIYTAISLAVNAVFTTGLAAAFVHEFEFVYMKEFAVFLLGDYCLLSVLGLFTAFVTELCTSKIPGIVYAVFLSTNIMSAIVNTINENVRNWGFDATAQFSIENYFASLYQSKFFGDLPMENNMVIHALVLSFVAFIVYNILGSVLITKRDVK